jgi:hypothetical protein
LIEDLERASIPVAEGPHGRTTILCTDYSPRLEETIRLLLDGLRIDAIETVDI